MKLTIEHPLNQSYLTYAAKDSTTDVPVSSPDDHHDPYMGAGTHPDIVQRIWTAFASLGDQAMVYGSPAVIHRNSGVILAVGFGTTYIMRVHENDMKSALAAGCKVKQSWSYGEDTDLSELLGSDWVFGAFEDAEPTWVAAFIQAHAL